MTSTLSNSVRVKPQRATLRLANFLDAAAELFAEIGYEAATMTVIAERSGSGIGTLYHYFPEKQSMALALLNQYAKKIEAHWKPLTEQTETLSHTAFAEMFLERITEFLRQRPAYLKLLTAPIRFSRDPAARRALRVAIANAFRAKDPSLTNEKAMVAANITLQMVKGMTTLYAEAGPGEKPLIITSIRRH
jgi:AcrR family transcriptional regulator